jgi:hypothetical protein
MYTRRRSQKASRRSVRRKRYEAKKGTGGGGEHEIGKAPSTTIDRVSLVFLRYIVGTRHSRRPERRKPICLWLAQPKKFTLTVGPDNGRSMGCREISAFHLGITNNVCWMELQGGPSCNQPCAYELIDSFLNIGSVLSQL